MDNDIERLKAGLFPGGFFQMLAPSGFYPLAVCWIGIRLDLGDNDWAGIADWLRKSWIAIAPPKLRQGFAIADEF